MIGRKAVALIAMTAASILVVVGCGSTTSSTMAGTTSSPMPMASTSSPMTTPSTFSPMPSSSSSSTVTIGMTTINGTQVLTDSKGFTLYAFSVDTAKKSECTGSCAMAWPPVTGNAVASKTLGLDKMFGTISGNQITYNGHPLYTYAGDDKPGQDRGNGITANGGQWCVVPTSGNVSFGMMTSSSPTSMSTGM